MPKVTIINKSRKERICNKCGQTIPIGSKLYTWGFFLGSSSVERFQHIGCGSPKPSQLTLNEVLVSIYSAQEALEDELKLAACKEDIQAAVSCAISEAENARDEYDEKMNNMEEYNLNESEAYATLEQRREAIEEWISELEQLESEDEDESFEDFKSKAEEACGVLSVD